ncbi:unnamed protein product [Angiostrongylus costaricensis]|uniref:Homeobox domain-containing protein n=1 Tax=Angiostrongylus costaricensis TaxID=334426 RepID=A0A0R3PHW1_ANGCS|nr:unnamed protein product [Angiostrongylus costaricensis]
MEVLVERKEFIRAQLDPTLYETQTPSNQINQVLRLLDNPVLPISPDEERDEETEKMEKDLNRALESIRWKQEITEIETKQTIANGVMLVQTRIIEATKRRRNFSKEAVAILQEYYDNHLAHPYPSEREKIRLAEKCHISVQQYYSLNIKMLNSRGNWPHSPDPERASNSVALGMTSTERLLKSQGQWKLPGLQETKVTICTHNTHTLASE